LTNASSRDWIAPRSLAASASASCWSVPIVLAAAPARSCSSSKIPRATVCDSDSRASVWLFSDAMISWNRTTAIMIIGTMTMTTKKSRRRALKLSVRSCLKPIADCPAAGE
jgi:hypothetical protein